MTAALFFMGARTRAASNFVLWLSGYPAEKDLGGDFMYAIARREQNMVFCDGVGRHARSLCVPVFQAVFRICLCLGTYKREERER